MVGIVFNHKGSIAASAIGRAIVDELYGDVLCTKQLGDAVPFDAERLGVVAVCFRPLDEAALLLGDLAAQRVGVECSLLAGHLELLEQQGAVGLEFPVGFHGCRVAAFHEKPHHLLFAFQQ